MNRRILLMGSGAALLLAGAVVGGRMLVSRNSFFQIRAIEFHGLRYIDEQDLAGRLGLPDSAHIDSDLEPMAAAIATLPGVRDVRVERRWPGTVVVTLQEAAPVAVAPVGDSYLAIDDQGVVLPYHPGRVRESLPLAPRDSITAALLARLASVDPEGYAGVERASRSGQVVTLAGGGRAVLVRQDADAGMLRDLAAVRSRLIEEGIAWRELDARFRDRVFVRRGNV
jgi:cell division protein FtsQ